MTRAAIEGQYFLLVRKCERRGALAQNRWHAIVVMLFCVAIFLCTYLGLVRRLGRSFFLNICLWVWYRAPKIKNLAGIMWCTSTLARDCATRTSSSLQFK